MPQSLPAANMSGRRPHQPGPSVLGIDVAKAEVVIHDGCTRHTFSVPNRPAALARALKPYAHYRLGVCEVTGGYEQALLTTAHRLGLPMHRAHPNRVKAFIASHGGRAKTDAIDARWLARYAADRGEELPAWTPPCPLRTELAELTNHREALIGQRTKAKNRLSAPGGAAIKALLAQEIDVLNRQIAAIEAACDALMARIAGVASQRKALLEIPGIGPATVRTLIAALPELGTLSAKRASSLSGLAPHPRQSGQTDRHRTMTAGRPAIRRALFLAALSAARTHPHLKTVYKRLTDAGKPPKLAIAAIARKLLVIANAIARTEIAN